MLMHILKTQILLDTTIQIPDLEAYYKYHKADDNFYQQVIKESLKSDYPDSALDMEEKYPIGPINAYLTDKFVDKEYNAIDTVKAYTYCFQQIDHVGVFGYFDIVKKYDGHIIEDLTMY